ncbi:MAG: four helix bundle protein [Deltaproteobacteria bacterium]|nr:four helix bundle protein [Deltaproteobacteria bacterium]
MQTQALPPVLPHKRYQAFKLAVELACQINEAKVGGGQGALRDQVRRAANSVALNIAEGAGRAGNDRLAFFRIARASACETSAAIELLEAFGALSPQVASETQHLCDRLYALLTKMAELDRP